MRNPSPHPAFSRLATPPPRGTMQLYDGYFPYLLPGNYKIGVAHSIAPPSQSQVDYQVARGFVVEAPEFTIDPGIVQMQYPPPGGSDLYGSELPFLAISDPSLPWERRVFPGQPAGPHPQPWIALVLLAEDEVLLPRDANNPVWTCTVQELIEPDPLGATLKPELPAGWVSPSLLATSCQIVSIPGKVFAAVMPTLSDLPYLAHCRAVNVANEDQTLLSVLLANRLPLSGAAPRRYYAHLVSLEGFGRYLGPDALPIPTSASGQMMDVQMVSLLNWTFVSLPEVGLDFEQLMTGLIGSQTSSPVLALPLAADIPVAQPTRDRIADGYSALTFAAGAGEQSFAWYRGPFSPVVPQPLPGVGAPAVPVGQARTADALMIYLAEQGLFDLSYAAAWNIGRALALADAGFAQAVNQLGHAASSALNRLTQRLAMPHFAGETDLAGLIAVDATRQRFKRLIGAGLGRRWTEALATPARRARGNAAHPGAIHPREVVARPEVQAALRRHLASVLEPVIAWLVDLILLHPVPFSHLVPDARMLPAESIRFFYVDSAWLAALTAGALSIRIRTSRDLALLQAVRPAIDDALARQPGSMAGSGGAAPLSGVLIRSQMVSRWPALAVSARLAGTPLTVIRDDRPAPYVRLTLFDGVPDTVRVAEPYQGLRFGIEDNGIAPRYVTSGGPTGRQIPGITVPPTGGSFVDLYCRAPAGQAVGGVIEVAALAAALATATGAAADTFGAGDFALQMVKAPEMQPFAAPPGGRAR